jgi:hypothetical protein
MLMGHPTLCTVPPPKGVGLACRVLGRGGSSLLGRQALLWRSLYPCGPTHRDCQAGPRGFWTDAAWPNHPVWGGAEFRPSLSEGVCKLYRYPEDWVPSHTSSKSRKGARCASTRCHISCNFGPHLPAEVGFSATTCPSGPDLASLLR